MKTITTPQALQIIRKIKAPREKVFSAFGTLEAMKPWFGPGNDCHLSGSHAFQPGGAYRIVMNCPDMEDPTKRADYVVRGTFQEIRQPEKIVFSWAWEEDPAWVGVESLVTVEFLDAGGETELRLTQQGFPSEDSREKHDQGWNASFDKMVAACA